MDKKQYKINVGNKELMLEISSMAERTNAAVLAKYGETVVLVTVVMDNFDSDSNYMPLKVDYEEKFYAAGKIIGSRFIRREGRPSEEAILTGRLVDRTIRPLFDNRIRRNIQVVATVLSFDEENDPDFVGLMGASTALHISNVPWAGPVGAVRVAKIGEKFVVNPDNSNMKGEDFKFDAFVAGAKGNINMIELGGGEAKETDVLKAFEAAREEIDKLTEFQEKIRKEVGKNKEEIQLPEPNPKLKAEIEKFLSDKLPKVIYESNNLPDHYSELNDLKDKTFEHIKEVFEEGYEDFKAVDFLFEEAINDLVHKGVLESNKRPDGRALDAVRNLEAEVKLFERTHGSAYFERGNTHALAITTLGPPDAAQLIETMETTGKRRFMLHYNFPPYSVGETGTFRGPGRRDIGHGALAEKAIKPLIPSKEEFPYAIRVVSEILSSNGSSSMATVCAGMLSLMDAGVPLKKPVAGIAMGLMMDQKGKYKVLTDIQGPEDHHGDMDLKVAGTRDGVTAIQMDVKVSGVSVEILEKALEQARGARLRILDFTDKILAKPREELSRYAPSIAQLTINPEKIGMVIGPGGKMINGLIAKYGLAGIDIEDDGSVAVSGTDHAQVQAAVEEIRGMTKEYKIGDIIEGNVIKILDFGAIVDLGGGQDGMIHVSELKDGFVKSVTDVVKQGDFVRAKVIKVDNGHIGLSLKQLKDK
ncbi:MAG: polyribonucleotide nucleotidyltransferase [bacterium]|nr:polyribonucleotide nucleotidyltransferase [bacterium]